MILMLALKAWSQVLKPMTWNLRVFLPVDPDFTYINDLILTQAQVTRTLLTLTWALMSQTCA